MKLLISLFFAFAITGCSAIDVRQYENNEPRLDLFDYFSGETTGWGIVQDRNGRLLRQFVVHITGTVDGSDRLTLDEEFLWNDGERSQRTWVLTKQNTHEYTGTAADVVDQAAGTLYGNVLNWKYRLNLEVDNRTWKITFDDWMYKVSEDLVINKAIMSKFGFRVGEVTIVFKK